MKTSVKFNRGLELIGFRTTVPGLKKGWKKSLNGIDGVNYGTLPVIYSNCLSSAEFASLFAVLLHEAMRRTVLYVLAA